MPDPIVLSPDKKIVFDIINRFFKGENINIDPDLLFKILYTSSSDISMVDKYYLIPMIMYIIRDEIEKISMNKSIINRRLT